MEESSLNSKLNLYLSKLKDFWNNSNFAKILPILIIGLAIPLTVFLSQKQQTIRQGASNFGINNSNTKDSLPPKGYIVEFKTKPVSRLVVADLKTLNKESIRVNFESAEKQLLQEHEIAKADILKKLGRSSFDKFKNKAGDSKVVLLNEFTNSFNGIAVDVDSSEIDKIKSSPFVKAVYPNNAVQPFLMDSVPLIGADKVWQNIKDKFDGSPVTGKGINIAIIDTGIDYLHGDLGKTNIVERNFTQINQGSDVATGKIFSLDQNRIAFFVGSEINLINLSTGEKRLIATDFNSNPGAIVLKNNYMAYIKSGVLYYYDLIKNKETTIGSIDSYEKFGLGKEKLVLSNRGVDVIWDMATGTKKNIARANGDNSASFIVYGTKVAYLTDTVTAMIGDVYHACSGKLIMQDLETLVKTEIPLPNSENIIDYDGNRILYATCPKAADTGYRVYDLSTGSIVSLSTASPNPLYPKLERPEGKLAGNLVYFTNPNLIANVYDSVKNRTVRINVLKKLINFQAEGDKACLVSDDAYIYCHTYDPNFDYYIPSTVFNQKVIGGYDFFNNDPDPWDDQYHGTHVAAIAAGNGALKGVAPEANLYAYKVFDPIKPTYSSTIIKAIDQAVSTRFDSDPNNDITVMNMSLGSICGTYSDSCGPNDPLSKAVDNATSMGIVSVIGAGNSGNFPGTIGSPGTARSAITVGATDKTKKYHLLVV